MEIYINECSFHEQFFDRSALNSALKVFFSILNTIKEIQDEFAFYSDENLVYVYKAISDEVLIASLHNSSIKGLDTAIIDLLHNKIKAKDWKNEQVHSVEDIFVCDEELVTETSIAELAERVIRNNEHVGIVINFSNSKYTNKTTLEVTKNDTDLCGVDCVEEPSQIEGWLSHVLGSANNQYDYESDDPPRDKQTVLKNLQKFRRTGQLQSGRMVYTEIETGYYWYVDNLHVGNAAHLEVFDSEGTHIGESSLDGKIDRSKQSSIKTIDV